MNCELCGGRLVWCGSLARGSLRCPSCNYEGMFDKIKYVLMNDKKDDDWVILCPHCNFVNTIQAPVSRTARRLLKCDVCDKVGFLEVK